MQQYEGHRRIQREGGHSAIHEFEMNLSLSLFPFSIPLLHSPIVPINN
jgi:hypothetical protein